MATAMSLSIARIAREEAARLPWDDIRRMVEAIGDLKLDLKVPEGVEVTKQHWCFVFTLIAAGKGLMVLRDGYGEGVTITLLPDGLSGMVND